MLHVLVTEFGSGLGSTLIGTASGTSAIGDNEGVLVLGKKLGQVLALRVEMNGARDMALLVGGVPVDVDHGNLAGLDGFLQVLDADIGILTSEKTGRKEGKNKQ